jgi:Outer membrane protein/protective antigen OMA87
MWGCLRGFGCATSSLLVLLTLIVVSGWWYLGSSSFAGLVRLRIEKTLEARLGREVDVGPVTIERGQLSRITINGLRIGNAPGAVHPYFATAARIVITGGIDSFWGRKIKVDRIDIVDPHLYFEIYPEGSKLAHNFPRWSSEPQSRSEIYHLDLGKLYITGGAFEFLDRRSGITAAANDITSTINVTAKEDLYTGVLNSPQFALNLKNALPIRAALRAQLRFTPDNLDLQSVALDGGPDLRIFLNGKVAPLSEAVYNLHVTSQIGLNRIHDIFKAKPTLEGLIDIDGMLRGKGGNFALKAGWVSHKIHADAFDLVDLRGTMNVAGDRAGVDIQQAKYGGGTITGRYDLAQYTKPYPMRADLRYNGVSLEKLLNDLGVKDTGLRGAATGHLVYHWNNDLVLAGAGEGNAALAKSTTVFSHAVYAIPINGSTDFTLDNGVITFRRAQLVADSSTIDLSGKFRIVDSWTDVLLKIHSSDFAELDRLAYNFANPGGRNSYTLLGLGGSGDVSSSVHGRLQAPAIVARVDSRGMKFNNVLLGDAEIDFHREGTNSRLTFDRATFHDSAGRLGMTGTLTFPDVGPSPQFDIALDAVNYPIERADQAVSLKLGLKGTGTGHLVVTGDGDDGKVTFANFVVHEAKGDLRLSGTVAWAPGKGNTTYDLDIVTTSFPVAGIITFLDLGTLPVTGEVSGRLHLIGPKTTLGGSGQMTIANGTIGGEPVTSARADVNFTKGALKATNVTVVAPAGTITGEAQVDFGTNEFSYTIKSSSIDLSRLKLLSSLAGVLGGNITLTSTGAGTLTQPELVLEATLNQATLSGLNLPADAPPPKLYIAIRDGKLIVRGSAAGLLTIEGDGSVATDGTLSGLVQVRVTDIAKALAMSPKTATLPAAGSLTANLQLGGKLTSIETLRIDATFPELNIRVSEHAFMPARPIHLSLRDGRIVFDDFELALSHDDSPATFAVGGFAELTGAKRLNVDLRGTLEAALLQLFVTDLRADGHIAVAGNLTGTTDAPHFIGTAEFQNASARVPGLPQAIDAITGTLIFRADRIDIDSIRLRLGGGQIVLGGSVALEGMTPKSVRVTMQGTEVAIRYYEGLTLEANFALLLSGDLDRAVLTGDVTVNRALYFRDTDIGAALLNAVLSRRGVTPVVSAAWQDHIGLRLHLTSDNTLAVRNNIADFAGSADIEVTGTLGNPVILGLVTLNEGGRIRFQDVDYRVVRGSVNFQNPFRIDPFFDVSLEARVSGGISEIESGPLDVTVTLTGTIDRMTPSITSDPPASDITLFSLLGLGALTRNTNTPLTAGTAGRSLLFQSVSRYLNSGGLSLFDSFAISPDPGDLDKTGDPGTKVSFEKRLSNNVRALVIYNTRDSKNRISIEWQVTPDWVLQFTSDQLSNEYDIQARFRQRYEGHWAWGTHGSNPFAMLTSFNTPTASIPAPPPITIATTAVALPAGAMVSTVGLLADSAIDTSAFTQYVSVKAGQPLSIRNVQASVKSLFATGNFRDIRVDATPSGNGLAVVFALYTNFRVSAIDFDGLRGADRDRALRALTFHIGDVLSLDAVDHSAVAVQDLLKRSGYLDAAVDPDTTFVRAQSRASVVFGVTRGTLATAGTVTIDGNTAPFTPQQLIDQMKRRPGKSFDLDEARIDADRMRQWLLRKEYRKATVRYDGNTYDPATHKVALRYSATTGPVVNVEVTGVSRRSLGSLLPFRRYQPYSEDAIDRAAADIVTSLQLRGFYNATVDTEGALHGNIWTSAFHVNPGPQFHLSAVTFTGNAQVSDKTLQSVVSTSASGGIKSMLASLLRRPQGVTREQLAADRTTLESYYRLHGFLAASASTPLVRTDAATGAMTIEFPIAEGPRTMVASVGIEGNEQLPEKDLPKPALRVGDALNPTIERNDVIALQTGYSDRGNAEVQVQVREEVSADKLSARVVYTIAEGPKIALGDVVVRGNAFTHTNVVLRTAQLEKGQPFSYTAILEAQQRLYRLGIFQRVDIQSVEAPTNVAERNVTISVAEGKDVSVAGAIGGTSPITPDTGANSISPLVSASIAHRNLFGTGQYLGLELIHARPNRQDVFLTYRDPFIGRYNVPIQVTAFQKDDFRRNTHLRQRGGFIEASRISRDQTRWSLRYEYRIAQCIIDPNKKADLCALAQNALLPGLDRDATNVSISSLTPAFFWDKRDDSLNPHRGFFTTASVEYAFRFIAANARFLKEFTQTSWYLPVSERSTFAVSGRVGLIQDLGNGSTIDPVTGALIPTSGVPLSERFTAGGDTSNRAYPLDLLGTACPTQALIDAGCRPTLIDILDPSRGPTIAPIGGRALLILNAEYRFPIAGAFGGQLFVDAGNTFADTKIQFGDLKYGAGTGLRYISPVGPIRFDLGYKLKRQILRYERGKAVYEPPFAYVITLGYAF